MAKNTTITPQERKERLQALARALGFHRFIILPHPSNQLSKNGRAFYLQEARLKDKLQAETMNQLQLMKNKGAAPKFYHLMWVYKGTRPDDDNVITRCKYARDTIAKFYDFDDRDLQIAGFPCVDFIHDKALAGFVIISFFDFPIQTKTA